jgi:hypothetical protein
MMILKPSSSRGVPVEGNGIRAVERVAGIHHDTAVPFRKNDFKSGHSLPKHGLDESRDLP